MSDDSEPVPVPGEETARAVDPDLLLAQPIAIDAPLATKATFFGPTVGVGITGVGQSSTTAAAPAGARTAVRGQRNWVPIGPRNVGGRLRDIAVHPTNPAIMYAASASGGVFKSLDGAATWFPLWHDEPSLAHGALSICRDHPDVVWAGTGEPVSGTGDPLRPAGVWRSADAGVTWRGPDPGQAILSRRIHAIAAHPALELLCWAAAELNTGGGLFRTLDGGRTWHEFCAGRGFSDVRFARFPGGIVRLFAVPEGPILTGPPDRNDAFLIRIDDPNATDAVLDAMLPAFVAAAPPFDTAGNPDPLRLVGIPMRSASAVDPLLGKVAIFEGTAAPPRDPVVFVAYTHADQGATVLADRSYYGIFRIRDAHTAAQTAMTFREIRPGPTFGGQGQGDYNIAFAVHPQDPNVLAFGMVELYVHRAANATNPPASAWLRAQMWTLYHVERGHHADHHAVAFAPVPPDPHRHGAVAGAMALWDANDGGLSWCPNVTTGAGFPMSDPANAAREADSVFPLPPGTFNWHKRGHGIVAPQMYDVAQHPRLPSVIGCGFQDNGSYIGAGGPSWYLATTADGGFIAFDPDDPYRALVTIQNNVRHLRFLGRTRETIPLLGDSIIGTLFLRAADDGFRDTDPGPFVEETVYHPRRPGRVLTARVNRLYGTRPTAGERWFPEPLGTTFQLVARPPRADARSMTVDVLDSAGGRALGLVGQRAFAERAGTQAPRVEIWSLAREPFNITPGQDLRLRFSFVPPAGATPAAVDIVVPLTIGPTLPAAPTAGQLATYLTSELRTRLAAVAAAQRPTVEALPLIPPRTREVLIASTTVGTAQQVTLAGTALATLRARARAYRGVDAGAGGEALPAMAPVAFFNRRDPVDLTGLALRIERQGATHAVDIDCDTEFGAAVTAVTPPALVAVLRRRLPAGQYAVWSETFDHGIRLSSLAASNVLVQGDFAGDLITNAATPARTVRLASFGNFSDIVDLTPTPPPPARTFRLREAANSTVMQNLDAAFLGLAAADLDHVTITELLAAIRRMLTAAPAVRMRADLHVGPDLSVARGEPTEVTFGPVGTGIVWVGDSVGRLYRSDDDGERWRSIVNPLAERGIPIDAIGVHPVDTDVVVVAAYQTAPAAPLFVVRSTDGGRSWGPCAAPIADTGGAMLGVRAFEFDPAAPGDAYAATDHGVFRSTDGGDRWAPFNEGLPNVRVTDLALATPTRMLRAGAWGRGIYERDLGAHPVRDVRLHLRTTVIDEGLEQPAPGPDVFATSPISVRLDQSPDIKLTRRDPRVGLILDGVELDDQVRTRTVREGPAFVCVQVHNRGAFPTRAVRVSAFWAPADEGPPPVPPELWAALGAPIAAGTTFGAGAAPWTLVGDGIIGDDIAAGRLPDVHDVVAPVAPRVIVFGGGLPFAWPAGLPRRVGVLAVVRSPDDPLPAAPGGPVEVIDIIRREAKVAYREADVVTAAVDDSVVLRSTDGVNLRILAGTPAAQNGANGAAPLGLVATAAADPGALEARFGRAGPYDLSTVRRFTISQARTVTVTFAAGDQRLPNLAAITGDEAATVIEEALQGAGMAVRAIFGFAFADGRPVVRLQVPGPLSTVFTVGGTAAATFGVTAGAPVSLRESPFAQRGPWNLTALAPATLVITATQTMPIVLGPGVPEIPTPATAAAIDVRAAIGRQLRERGVLTVVAEPLRRVRSVRRSATETTTGGGVLGGLALADLVAAPAAVVGDPAQRALFDVLTTHGADRLTAGGNNDLYLRSANTGNVAEAAVRHRLFLVDVTVSPLTFAALGAPVPRAIPAESSIIVPFTTPIPPLPSGSHQFVLCVADVDEDGQRIDVPPAAADIASIDTLHAFCLRTPGTAIREFVVT